MDDLIYLYGFAVLISAAMAGLVIWGAKTLLRNVSVLALTGLLMATIYISLVILLGRPKPVAMEWSAGRLEGAEVLAASFDEEVAIYLWVVSDGAPEPRAYRLPWSLQTAIKLQQALQRSEADGGAVKLRGIKDKQDPAQEQPFYAEPQEALPAKLS